MAECTPPSIELLRTSVQENAPSGADTARWYFLIALGISMLMPLGTLAAWFTVPPNMFVLVVSMQVAWVLVALTATGLFWMRARKRLPNYANQTRNIWTLACRDVEHSWEVAGLGSCEGWRRVAVRCVRLPKRQDKMLAVPALKVEIYDDEKAIASGRILENGNTQHVGLLDKAGKPLRIMIAHDRPEHASDEFPWEVEVMVQGDANVPETLVATPSALNESTPT